MNTWVIVADGSHARVFERSRLQPLTELQAFVHPQSRQSNIDSSDEYGRKFVDSRERQFIETKVTPLEREERLFARELGRFLDGAEAEHRFDELVLVAPPAFLGALRDEIEPRTQRHITCTVNKDFTQLDQRDLARSLKDHIRPSVNELR